MPLISDHTGEQVRQLIAEKRRPIRDVSTGGGVRGRLPIFVKCTSTTAAAGSGVGAQCYSGVVVDPKADDTTQEELGTVWLTLLTDSGAVVAPRLNGVYECLLAGVIDATGADDSRPRAFSAPSVADDGSGGTLSDCARILGLVESTLSCFKLTTVKNDGSCASMSGSQNTLMPWDSGSSTRKGDTNFAGPDGTHYKPTVDVQTTSCGKCIRMRFVGVESGASTITFMTGNCGTDSAGNPYIEFYTTDPLLCTDDPNGACGENTFKVRMTCSYLYCGVTDACPACPTTVYPKQWRVQFTTDTGEAHDVLVNLFSDTPGDAVWLSDAFSCTDSKGTTTQTLKVEIAGTMSGCTTSLGLIGTHGDGRSLVTSCDLSTPILFGSGGDIRGSDGGKLIMRSDPIALPPWIVFYTGIGPFGSVQLVPVL